MNVKELITKLLEMPMYAEVYTTADDEGTDPILVKVGPYAMSRTEDDEDPFMFDDESLEEAIRADKEIRQVVCIA